MLGNIISENGSVRGNEKFGPCQVFFSVKSLKQIVSVEESSRIQFCI